MHCPSCDAQLPPDLAFCLWCGAGLSAPPGALSPAAAVEYTRCGVCSKLVTAHARFCTGCGSVLGQAEPGDPAPADGDERRTVTVLQGDLVAFSRLVEALSPEEVKLLLDSVYTALTREVIAQGGMVDKFIGDAVLAFFGVPHAHGDDPRRAVEAALAMHKALDVIGQRLRREKGLSLTMRVGIETGPAVVGSVAGVRRPTVTGPVLTAAMELEAAAPPGGVLVGPGLRRLLEGGFETRRYVGPRGTREAYLIDGRAEAGGLPAVASPTRLVGRELELAQLAALLERSVSGSRVVAVTLVGPAGIGKSRLIRGLLRRVAEHRSPPPLVFMGTSAPLGRGGSVDLPTQWIRVMAGGGAAADVSRADVAQLVTGALAGAREAGEIDVDEAVTLIAYLVGATAGKGGAARELLLDPARVRRQTVVAVAALLAALARRAPLVLVGEDQQWSRPSAAALVDEILAQVEGAPILYIRVLRTDEAPGDPQAGPTTLSGVEQHEIRLAPLGRQAALAMIREVTGEGPGAGPRGLSVLVDAADGNPRFVMELARHLREPGALDGVIADAAGGAVKGALQQLLQARLDRLPEEERRVLRAAAVVGLTFWDEGLTRMGIPTPGPALAGLAVRGLVRRRRMSTIEGAAEYVFSSDAVREVAYANVLVKVRRFLHQVAAAWLEERLGERAYEFAEALAYHHFEGGRPLPAARYLSAAADRARALYANDDARLLMGRAMEILAREAGAEARSLRAHLEEGLGDLRQDKGEAEVAMAHYLAALQLRDGLPGVAEALSRARLHMRAGEVDVHRSRQEAALARFAAARGELDRAGATDAASRALGAEIAKATGWGLWRLGRREEARLAFEQGLAPISEETEVERVIAARLHSALGLLCRFRGAPEEALERHGHALKLARQTSNLELRCVCLVNWAAVLVDLGLLEQARGCYLEALEVQERIGREEDAAISRINLAQVALEREDLDEASRLGEEARARLEVQGTHWALPELYRILAELELRRGRRAEARGYALLAVSMGERVENHYYVGGAHRILGDLARDDGDLEEAGARYHAARARLEEIGEPRELARVILRQVELEIGSERLGMDEAREEIERITQLLRPYPDDPLQEDVERLRARVSAS